jgi:hypothetical protein
MPKKLALTCTIITAITLLLIATTPSATAANGNLETTNISGAQFIFTYDQLLAMPKTYSYADLLCYGNLVTTGNWGGVQLSYLLAQANLTQETGSIQFLASDGYKVTIPIDLALQPQVILAYEKDSQPLSEGYRLVLPELNGAAWIAQIASISMPASGANYPEVASAGGGSFSGQNLELNNPTVTPQPTPAQTPPPTPQPAPTNTPDIQAATQTHQPTQTPQTTNANITSKTMLLYAITSAFAVSLAAAVTVAIKRKSKKLK